MVHDRWIHESKTFFFSKRYPCKNDIEFLNHVAISAPHHTYIDVSVEAYPFLPIYTGIHTHICVHVGEKKIASAASIFSN